MTHPLRLALTPGEPAGIGPDLAVALGARGSRHDIVVFADPDLLRERARVLGVPLQVVHERPGRPRTALAPGTLVVEPVALAVPAVPGRLDARNARPVLEMLARAMDACRDGACDALVTGPVHKGIINEAGVPFSGHTEFLAERLGGHPVMMLACPGLRVALATTHLPLRAVPDAITGPGLERVLRILDGELRARFGIAAPRIRVCGLNPHAGEGGHLGREEVEIIAPLLERLRTEGLELDGPLPADTLFTPRGLRGCDAVLAMYHDQGLPVLKHLGFGNAVNITLGLPIVRTSVDHGTALELAGTGQADSGSLLAAIDAAAEQAGHRA